MQLLVLQYIANNIPWNREYTEPEMNKCINEWHTFNDPALIRREFFMKRIVDRTLDGGKYWRTDGEASSQNPQISSAASAIDASSLNYVATHLHYHPLQIDEHLELVEPRMEHALASLSWVQTIDVVQYMGADFPCPTLEGEQKRIAQILENTDEYSWMIENNKTCIGNVSINDIAATTKHCNRRAGNLTVLIGEKESWGKGIGYRACRAVIAWAFQESTFEILAARALKENTSCISLLSKLGFTETGREPYEGLVHGKKSEWRRFVLTAPAISITRIPQPNPAL